MSLLLRTGSGKASQECLLPPLRVTIVHVENCEFTDKLVNKIKEDVPNAKITLQKSSADGAFEYFINDKIVFSKLHLGKYPNLNEMVEIAYWASKGKSFMHMYLCTVAEGGEPNMVVADKKKTSMPKRMLLACVIS